MSSKSCLSSQVLLKVATHLVGCQLIRFEFSRMTFNLLLITNHVYIFCEYFRLCCMVPPTYDNQARFDAHNSTRKAK